MSTKSKLKEMLDSEDFVYLGMSEELTHGSVLRILREKNNLSQNQLAELTGLRQTTISGIENNRIKLGVERAKVLARALNVHPAVLAFPNWEVVA